MNVCVEVGVGHIRKQTSLFFYVVTVIVIFYSTVFSLLAKLLHWTINYPAMLDIKPNLHLQEID